MVVLFWRHLDRVITEKIYLIYEPCLIYRSSILYPNNCELMIFDCINILLFAGEDIIADPCPHYYNTTNSHIMPVFTTHHFRNDHHPWRLYTCCLKCLPLLNPLIVFFYIRQKSIFPHGSSIARKLQPVEEHREPDICLGEVYGAQPHLLVGMLWRSYSDHNRIKH